VLINGAALDETYLPDQGITDPRNEGESFTVPDGCVFLLGDHRDNSLDSRFWLEPFIPVSSIHARALVEFSLWPDNTWCGVRRLG
jgi:signal peptidase I